VELPSRVVDLLRDQAGVIARHQALQAGLVPSMFADCSGVAPG